MPFLDLPHGDGSAPGWIVYVLVVGMGVWGGYIHYVSVLRSEAKPFNLNDLIIELSTAAFVAVVVGLGAIASNIHWLAVIALSGVVGHASGITLALLTKCWVALIKSLTRKG